MKAATYRRTVLLLLLLHAAMLAVLAHTTPWTTDEPNYLQAGIALRKQLTWDVLPTVLHGPLTFYGNQVACWLGASDTPWEDAKLGARLGMLPWALLCAALIASLTRRGFGERAAVAALLVHVLNPVILAHGCLITSDMALAASTLLVAVLAWRWLERPGLLRLAGIGVGLGIAFATKYLALLLVPALALTVAIAVLRGTRPAVWLTRTKTTMLARWLDLVPATLIVATLALSTLHAAYLFRAGGYEVLPSAAEPDPNDAHAGPLSSPLKRVVTLPGAPLVLSALPAPFVRGIDYQLFAGEVPGKTVFGERIGDGFATYYLTALATKLALGMLVLVLLGLVWRGPPAPREFATLVVLFAAVPFAYLSLGAKLQLGIRYALPTVALLAIPAGRAVPLLLAGVRVRWIAWALLLASAVFTVRVWPRCLSAFNALAGDRPWLIFVDSNLDWRVDYLPDRDEAELRRRWPSAVRVYGNGGPRFGPVIVHAADLAQPDPARPGHVHHWLRKYVPDDREGAWLAFDVTERAMRSFAANSERARVELAIALLATFAHNAAGEALGSATSQAALAVQRGIQECVDGKTQQGALAAVFVELGRSDRIDPTNQLVPIALRLQALFLERRFQDAVDLATRTRSQRPLQLDEALFLAAAQDGLGKPEAALTALDSAAPPPESPVWPKFAEVRAAYARQARAVRAGMGRGSGAQVR